MKITLLLLMMIVAFATECGAQSFKHFTVKEGTYNPDIVMLTPVFDTIRAGSESLWSYKDRYFPRLLEAALLPLSDTIKQEIVRQEAGVMLRFDPKGEIFHIIFVANTRDYTNLSEEQWLQLYRAIRNIKIDMSQIEIIELRTDSKFDWAMAIFSFKRLNL